MRKWHLSCEFSKTEPPVVVLLEWLRLGYIKVFQVQHCSGGITGLPPGLAFIWLLFFFFCTLETRCSSHYGCQKKEKRKKESQREKIRRAEVRKISSDGVEEESQTAKRRRKRRRRRRMENQSASQGLLIRHSTAFRVFVML